MRGSFVYHRKKQSRKRYRTLGVLTAVMLAVCLLASCGPEPGKEESSGKADGSEIFSEQDSGGGKGKEDGPDSAAGQSTGDSMAASDMGTAQTAKTGAAAGPVPGESASAGASTGAAAEDMFSHPIQGEIKQVDTQILEELQAYLNEDSSYGFLLSSYDIPEEIDLNQVFYSGAGFKQEELTEKEKELLLDRIPQKEIRTPVVKLKKEQAEELLSQKAGISYDESRHPLDQEDGWAYINRYGTWYALRGDTNRQYINCSDAWQQGDLYIIHYQLMAQAPEKADSAEADAAAAAAEETAETSETAETAETAEAAKAAETSETAETTETTETVETVETSETAEAAVTGETAAAAETTGAAETAEAAETTAAAETAEAAAAGQESPVEEEKNALYRPTYEVQLQKTEKGYRFCYNIVWTQKNLIEAQSYRAELKPAGEVFFAPYYPDTDQDEKADVTFVLEKDRAVLAILDPMEASNIRTDRIFAGVDAVDFTDYNQDGYMDILTICTYTQIADDGRKSGEIREARVYEGQEDAVPLLDREKTEAVNRDVEVLNITNVTGYLTGKSDGKARKYDSWKEAYAAHIEGIAEEEYEGFGLIYLNDDRTPELVQLGATTAKGATIVVYRNGTLEETWLNRRDFQYLEYENLLYSPSGVENLHFDTIYSITGGKLSISTQGYYGNSSFARVRFDENGKEVRDYFWEGGQVSESGYRDGISFLFDLSRAKTCQGDQLLTAAQLLERLK